jgi:hypothetical protein
MKSLYPFALFLTLVSLIGCAAKLPHNNTAIGYIGFHDNSPWAIQFNDCSEHEFSGAEKYLWYDRQLTSISCYRFKPADDTRLKDREIMVYKLPTLGAVSQPVSRFSELTISESGWGIFPQVYEVADGNWFRLKEGWIHLESFDTEFVQFYNGHQNIIGKAAHDAYFYNH